MWYFKCLRVRTVAQGSFSPPGAGGPHILRSKELRTGGPGRDNGDMKSLIWAMKAEGWWPTKGLSGVDRTHTEEGKALAGWQGFVPPGQICSGLSLSPHPEHMSSARTAVPL